MLAYLMLEEEGHDRPWHIYRAVDGHRLFTMVKNDRSFATQILNRLNEMRSLSPEDNDNLANAA